jgi:hypothetical protein
MTRGLLWDRGTGDLHLGQAERDELHAGEHEQDLNSRSGRFAPMIAEGRCSQPARDEACLPMMMPSNPKIQRSGGVAQRNLTVIRSG